MKQYDYHRLFPFQDHETLWKISGRRNIFDQQVVQVEEVVEGIQDHLQPQPRQGVLRHLEVISKNNRLSLLCTCDLEVHFTLHHKIYRVNTPVSKNASDRNKVYCTCPGSLGNRATNRIVQRTKVSTATAADTCIFYY